MRGGQQQQHVQQQLLLLRQILIRYKKITSSTVSNRCISCYCTSASTSTSTNEPVQQQQYRRRKYSDRIVDYNKYNHYKPQQQQQQQQQQDWNKFNRSYIPYQQRFFSSISDSNTNNNINNTQQRLYPQKDNDEITGKEEEEVEKEKLRIAIVGGGCAGLCTALQLAELVELGYIEGPIDVYYCKSSTNNEQQIQNNQNSNQKHNSRTVGVGIWSTAFDGFRYSNRPSYQYFYNQLINNYATYCTDVGYRTPTGKWILKSSLPNHIPDQHDNNTNSNSTMPTLLFVRECDFIQLFYNTIALYETNYISLHESTVPVQQLNESNNSEPYSTNILFTNGTQTNRSYHLIIAADGTHSLLRQRYAGHDAVIAAMNTTNHTTSTSTTGTQSDDDNDNKRLVQQLHNDIISTQDRKYTVFRGNAPISNQQMQQYDSTISFQTWGEGNNMRFATVPMVINSVEHQVWFITIDDVSEITNNSNNNSTSITSKQRQDWLIDKFKTWHEPITTIIQSTPCEQIYMDHAIAHTHNVPPVLRFNDTIQHRKHYYNDNNNNDDTTTSTTGTGPCLIFHGDAYMTIDPILAQGFTCAMEGSYSIKQTVQRVLEMPLPPPPSLSLSQPVSSSDTTSKQLAFDPYQLQSAIQLRHLQRVDRIKCVLQVTELVQFLGQPNNTSFSSGWLNRTVLRPLSILVPNFIKRPLFDTILKYSLGIGFFHHKREKYD